MTSSQTMDGHSADCLCDLCVVAKVKSMMDHYGPPEILGSLLDMGWRFREFNENGHVYVDLCPPLAEPEGDDDD